MSARTLTEWQQIQVIRALRAHAEARTLEQLRVATGLDRQPLAVALTSLIFRGEIVKLLRMQPQRPAIAVYLPADAMPDPLRAS